MMTASMELKRVTPASLDEVKELYASGEEVMVDLKAVPVELKAEIIKYALTLDELTDPLMTMNLINLVKVYNTLEDNYFASDDIFVNSVEELLDLKLAIGPELKEFARRISIYFLSLFKSYNKMVYNTTDTHVVIPALYRSVLCGTDLLTLSGIFAKAPKISTDELVFVDNAYKFTSLLVMKNAEALQLMNEALQAYEDKE